VACTDELLVLSPTGSLLHRTALKEEPASVAVAGDQHPYPGRVYIICHQAIHLYDADGRYLDTWSPQLKPLAMVAAAASKEGLYVADVVRGGILNLDPGGKLVREFGAPDPARHWPGLIMPSARTGMAAHPDGYILVANPGLRRVEVYDPTGRLEYLWGKESTSLEGFFGCCNPQSLAALSNGQVITSEKGILRIKIYSLYGDLEGVVAGPQQLESLSAVTQPTEPLADTVTIEIAANRSGEVWALAQEKPLVLIFAPTTKPSAAEHLSADVGQ
jgi:hypothetical protein